MRLVLFGVLLSGLLMLAGCASRPRVPSEVFVRARDYSTVKVLQDSGGLTSFRSLWYARLPCDPRKLQPINWDDAYKVDIAGDGMWLYHVSGHCTVMSLERGTVYEVGDAAGLNTLLGVSTAQASLGAPGR